MLKLQLAALLLVPFAALASLTGCQDDTATSGLSATALTDDEPVRLISAALEQKACSSCVLFSGMIEVKNVAFEKLVDVVYGCPVDEASPSGAWTWREAPARYQQGLSGDTEIWSFSLKQPGCVKTLQLALRYRVRGQTYWDNNCGWNYEIRIPSGSSAGGVSGRPMACRFRP